MPAELLTKLRTWIASKTTERDRHETAPLSTEVAVSMLALQHQQQEQEIDEEVEHLQQEEKQRHQQEQEKQGQHQYQQQQQQEQQQQQQQQQHVQPELKYHQEEEKQKKQEEKEIHQEVKNHQEEEEQEQEHEEEQEQQQEQQEPHEMQSDEVATSEPKAASQHNNSQEEGAAESDSASAIAEYQNCPHHRTDEQTPPRTSDSTKHRQDCYTLPNPPLQQSAEDPDEMSHLQEESLLTSGYQTMTPSPSLTSEDHAEPETSSMSQTNNTSSISSESLRSADPYEKQSSADDCLCKESVPFFCSCSRYPTVIHKPEGIPEAEDAAMDNPAEEGQATTAVCRRVPEYVALREAPQMVVGDVREEEEEQEEQRGRQEAEEMFPQTALVTPIGALRKSRRRLCLMLNIEMTFREETGLCADYRGLAELVGFEALEIDNFWERNPSDTLFLEWARSRDSRLQPAVLNSLVSCLLQLDRRDVLEDCRGLILEDVSDFLAERQFLITHSAVRLENYDCYVNIADADILTVGREIVDTLEGVYGLRLCLTLRDVQIVDWVYDSMAATLETRCNGKVLLVLTKNYEDSEACQFLMHFAAALDPRARQKKLIPLLVDDDAFVPRILRGFSRLNFKRDKELGFLWPRLKHAITG